MAEEGQGFIPILCGPVPCTNTTVGSFPSSTRTDSVPASDQSPVPILTSVPLERFSLTQVGPLQSDCSKEQQDTSQSRLSRVINPPDYRRGTIQAVCLSARKGSSAN